jgi:hypothetical protein
MIRCIIETIDGWIYLCNNCTGSLELPLHKNQHMMHVILILDGYSVRNCKNKKNFSVG